MVVDIIQAANPESYAQWGVIGAFIFSNIANLGILIWLLLSIFKMQEQARDKDREVIDNNTKALTDLQTEIKVWANQK